MKTRNLLIVVIIITIFSLSVAFAQTATKPVSSKVIGARVYTQTEFDSLKAELTALDDAATVNVGLLRKAMTYLHDVVLRDGHKEYVSMPGFFKKQVTNKIDGDINNIAEFVQGLDQSVTNIELVITGDETPITTEVIKTEIVTKPASEIAMEKIKKAVAARRAATK